MEKILQNLQRQFSHDFTASTLRLLIVGWAIFVIFLALTTDDAWLLAGILAYEILP